MNINIRIISKSEELPQMECQNFFHSTDMFKIIEQTPHHHPYMIIASRADGSIAAHMFACIRQRGSLIPPYLFSQGRIYGEGEYDEDINKDEVFSLMLEAITKMFRRKLCLYTEFSNISQKMFGYRHFKRNGYFPIPWQEVHNSLHSMSPDKRLTLKMRNRLQRVKDVDILTKEVETEEELSQFYKIIKSFYRMKFRRYIPSETFFQLINKHESGHLFITIYKEKIIGCSACVYSEANAYLWYLASKRKSYKHVHPDAVTIWNTIQHAHKNHYAHLYFMDVGLPYKNNKFRSFILKFGGKPVAKYRWFRISLPWINKVLSWIYSE